eukprot:Ihof_evm1s802 gene=Ihof_evmTU1s802
MNDLQQNSLQYDTTVEGDCAIINQHLQAIGCPTPLQLDNTPVTVSQCVLSIIGHLLRTRAQLVLGKEGGEEAEIIAREKDNAFHRKIEELKEYVNTAEQQSDVYELKWQKTVAELDRKNLELHRHKEEIARLNGIIKANDAQYLHRIGRTELEAQKLQEKLQKSLRNPTARGVSTQSIKVLGGSTQKFGIKISGDGNIDNDGYVETGTARRCLQLETEGEQLREIIAQLCDRLANITISMAPEGTQDEDIVTGISPLSPQTFQLPAHCLQEQIIKHADDCCNVIGGWSHDCITRLEAAGQECQNPSQSPCNHANMFEQLQAEIEHWQEIALRMEEGVKAYIEGGNNGGRGGLTHIMTCEAEKVLRMRREVKQEKELVELMRATALEERQTGKMLLAQVMAQKSSLREEKLDWLRVMAESNAGSPPMQRMLSDQTLGQHESYTRIGQAHH